MRLADLRSDLVILACAISGGIHGALVPSHLEAATGLGVGFAAATLALAAIVVWLTRQPESRLALTAAAGTLSGLVASYALATTTGLPVLHPDPEPVDGLALATKAIELVGLLTATTLLRRRVAVTHARPKGALT